MGLFGIGKKKDQATQDCGCGCTCGGACGSPAPEKAAAGGRSVLILGSGCENCRALEKNVRAALDQMGDTETAVGHVTDFAEIAKYGVMRTPALVVEGRVVSSGRVLSSDEAAALLAPKHD